VYEKYTFTKMTIFTKAKIVKILKDKVNSNEIKSFYLTDSYLRINKSKRTGFTFKINDFTENVLVRLITKRTPEPSVENIEDFYKKEIKRYET
jgi:hypothetical protein